MKFFAFNYVNILDNKNDLNKARVFVQLTPLSIENINDSYLHESDNLINDSTEKIPIERDYATTLTDFGDFTLGSELTSINTSSSLLDSFIENVENEERIAASPSTPTGKSIHL